MGSIISIIMFVFFSISLTKLSNVVKFLVQGVFNRKFSEGIVYVASIVYIADTRYRVQAKIDKHMVKMLPEFFVVRKEIPKAAPRSSVRFVFVPLKSVLCDTLCIVSHGSISPQIWGFFAFKNTFA